MPTYDVTDPASGVTLQLQGDSPPTESELTDIFDKAKPQAKPTEGEILIAERNRRKQATAEKAVNSPIARAGQLLTASLLPKTSTEERLLANARQMQLAEQVSPSTAADLAPPPEPTALGKTAEGIARGVQGTINDVTDFMTSPAGIATMGMSYLPKVAQRLIALGFAADMAKNLPEVATQLGAEVGKPEGQRDYAKISELVTKGTASLGLTTGLAVHGLAPETSKALAEVGVTDVKPSQFKTVETGGPNAPEIGKQQVGDKLQYPGVDTQRTSTEAGSGNRAAPSPQEQAAKTQAEPVANLDELHQRIFNDEPQQVKDEVLAAGEPIDNTNLARLLREAKTRIVAREWQPSRTTEKGTGRVAPMPQLQPKPEPAAPIPTPPIVAAAQLPEPHMAQPTAQQQQDALAKMVKQPDPNWQITVQAPEKLSEDVTVPGYVQVDDVTGGKNNWSSNPDTLREHGYDMPDFSGLPAGKYSLAQAKEMLAVVPQKATELTTPVGEQPSAVTVPQKLFSGGLSESAEGDLRGYYLTPDENLAKYHAERKNAAVGQYEVTANKLATESDVRKAEDAVGLQRAEDGLAVYKKGDADLVQGELIKQGFDGAVRMGGDEVIVFDKRNIKSTPVGEQPSAAAVPEMAGMGGAAAGEKPAKAELAQLEDTLKTMAADQPKPVVSQAYDLGEKVEQAKDAVSRSISGLQAAGQYVKERLINKPVFGPFKAAIGDWHLANTESVANAKKFVKTAARAVPDKTTQAAISNYIDTGGDDALLAKAAEASKPQYKAGYEKARNLTAEEKVIAENAKNYFEARLQQAQDAGILEAGIEDYIHRQYETDSPWKDGVLAELRSGIFTGQPALAKKRVFQYDFEAEQAGKKPIKSFFKRIAAYDISLNKAIADRKLVKDIMSQKASDGRPLIDVGGTGTKIEGPTGETDATLIKPQYKPGDTANPKNNRSDYKTYDHPALRKWKWATTDEAGKPIFVQGDVLVHPEAVARIKALFDRSAIRQNPYGRAALGLSSTIKQTMLDLSGFHFVQIGVHALEHRTFGPIKEIDFTNPDVRGLIRGGAVVGETRGAELFSEGLTGTSLTRHIPGLGPKLEQFNDYLFNSYIPRIKVAMGLHALERNKARFPELSQDELYHLTANQMNAAFGELNYAMLGRNRTVQDSLRLGLLAPDFLEARGRFVAQAGTKYGKEQFQALALGAATLYITARVINKLISDEYHFEPKNAFSVVYGGKAYSLRTVQGDLLHLVTEPGKFAYHRLNPVYGRTGLEFLTGRDVFGRKRDLLQQAQDFAQTPVPISFRGVLNPREQNLMESFLNAMGVTERRSTAVDTIGKLAQDYKEKNKIVTDPGEFIYDPDKDPYRAVRQAATFSSPETVADEVAKAVAGKNKTAQQIKDHFSRYARSYFTGSQANDNKFVKSLDADQKKLYQDARKEKQALLKNFNKGYSLYLARRRAATTTTPP